LFRLRIAANPADARSSVSAIIAHSESVGVAMGPPPADKRTLGPARLLPWSVTSVPAASALTKLPAAAAVTFTVNVQEPAGEPLGIVVPIGKLTDVAVALGVPTPQVVLGDPTVVRPLGKLSVKVVVTVAVLPLALVKVMMRVEVPPGAMAAGLKTLVSPTPPEGGTPAHPVGSMVSLINVTAPFRAKARPLRVTPLFMLVLVSAIIVPSNVVVVSRVAELPTCQKMLHLVPVPTTDEPGPVVSVLPILKTQTSVARPLRVSTPVFCTDDE
jgi:hypothetical protein